MEQIGLDATISDVEREAYQLERKLRSTSAMTAAAEAKEEEDHELPWSDDEELFISCRADDAAAAGGSAAAHEPKSSSKGIRGVVFVMALGISAICFLAQTAASAKRSVLL